MAILIGKTATFVQILCLMRMFLSRIFKLSSAVAVVVISAMSCAPRDRYVTVTGFAQGGTYSVKFNLNGAGGMIRQSPEAIKDSIDAILGAVDKSLSGYNRNSLLTRFNDGEAIVPDRIFRDMYSRAYDVFERTGGVVDAASGPLFDLWGFGFKSGDFPDEARVEKARARSGMGRLKRDLGAVLSAEGVLPPSALLDDPDASLPVLNFNAIAQGYSCDLVAGYLYRLGVRDMMVDIGEIYCDGLNPSGKQWTIGIDKPSDGNNERGAELQAIFSVPQGPHGVVTSGNYRKFYVRNGKKYAHTVDPRTGYPVSHNLLSATIVAKEATTADAYATYCMVVGLEASKSFIESSPDMEGCLVYDDGDGFRTWCSSGFVLKEL